MQSKRPILIFAKSAKAARELNAAFQAQDRFFPVLIVRSVEEAECYLVGIGIYGNRTDFPFPSLFVLHFESTEDIFNILAVLKNYGLLEKLILVGIGGHVPTAEIQCAYDAGLNWFCTLGDDLRALAWSISEMKWLNTSQPQENPDTP